MEDRYQLHIDLLRCEHCGQHNKMLHFCAACGRQRKTIIIAQPHDYKLDMQLDFRCRSCLSQRITSPFCIYCKRGMKSQVATYPYRKVNNDGDGTLGNRPTVEVYVDGLIRDMFTDTNELAPLESSYFVVRKRNKKKRPPQQKPVVRGRFIRTLFEKNECFVCESRLKLTIHHFVPTGKGGDNSKENMLTTCRPCHDKIHAKERTSKRRKQPSGVSKEQLSEALEKLAQQLGG